MMSNEAIICPHCKHEYEDWQNYGIETDDMEGNFNMVCEECEKEFNCKFEFVVTFTTK